MVADSKTIYFANRRKSRNADLFDCCGGWRTPRLVLADSFNDEFDVGRDGRKIVFSRTTLTMPAEIFVANADGTDVRQITHQNSALLAQLDLPPWSRSGSRARARHRWKA